MRINTLLKGEIPEFLKNCPDTCKGVIRIVPLTGDASERKYFRIHVKNTGADTGKSFILMKSTRLESEFIPFLDIQKTLKKLDIPVPEIFHSDVNSGLLLEEDCGDITLESYVKNHDEKAAGAIYRKAVDILIKMQFTDRHSAISSIARNRFFDAKKFLDELDFMMTHLFKGLAKAKVADADMVKISSGFRLICGELSTEPRVFTHRDYHSRNIMIQGNAGLKLLDFQDARMGPCQYDLVSLLKDSYSPLTSGQVNSFVSCYLERADDRGIHFEERRFKKIFDYMAVQRSLKAAGTFAFQKVEKGNDGYMAFIGPVLKTAMESMNRNSELLDLKNCLLKYAKTLL